jgi:hypothetical protein
MATIITFPSQEHIQAQIQDLIAEARELRQRIEHETVLSAGASGVGHADSEQAIVANNETRLYTGPTE